MPIWLTSLKDRLIEWSVTSKGGQCLVVDGYKFIKCKTTKLGKILVASTKFESLGALL